MTGTAAATTWVDVPAGHPFGIQTLPYGSIAGPEGRRVAVAVGEHVLDLTAAAEALLPERAGLFADGTLDGLLAAGPDAWAQGRAAVTTWLTDDAHPRTRQPPPAPPAA